MKTVLLSCIFCFLSLFSFGQKSISTALSPNHQAITGTKVSLIVPEGFTKGENFPGLQQTETSSSIMVLSIPGPISQILPSMTSDALAGQGIQASLIEPLQINGLPAMLIHGIQVAQGISFGKRILILGDESETLMLNGTFPEELPEPGEAIEQALFTVYYEAAKIIDPLAEMDWGVDVAGTRLQFGRAVGNTLLFTVDGKVPTASEDKTSLVVGQSISESNPADKRAFAINRILQTPYQIESPEFIREITVDGMDGFEIYAVGKNSKTNLPEYVYQLILFDGKIYFLLIGTTNQAAAEAMNEIQQAAKTFRRKG
jgi:hypothetical protein